MDQPRTHWNIQTGNQTEWGVFLKNINQDDLDSLYFAGKPVQATLIAPKCGLVNIAVPAIDSSEREISGVLETGPIYRLQEHIPVLTVDMLLKNIRIRVNDTLWRPKTVRRERISGPLRTDFRAWGAVSDTLFCQMYLIWRPVLKSYQVVIQVINCQERGKKDPISGGTQHDITLTVETARPHDMPYPYNHGWEGNKVHIPMLPDGASYSTMLFIGERALPAYAGTPDLEVGYTEFGGPLPPSQAVPNPVHDTIAKDGRLWAFDHDWNTREPGYPYMGDQLMCPFLVEGYNYMDFYDLSLMKALNRIDRPGQRGSGYGENWKVWQYNEKFSDRYEQGSINTRLTAYPNPAPDFETWQKWTPEQRETFRSGRGDWNRYDIEHANIGAEYQAFVMTGIPLFAELIFEKYQYMRYNYGAIEAPFSGRVAGGMLGLARTSESLFGHIPQFINPITTDSICASLEKMRKPESQGGYYASSNLNAPWMEAWMISELLLAGRYDLALHQLRIHYTQCFIPELGMKYKARNDLDFATANDSGNPDPSRIGYNSSAVWNLTASGTAFYFFGPSIPIRLAALMKSAMEPLIAGHDRDNRERKQYVPALAAARVSSLIQAGEVPVFEE